MPDQNQTDPNNSQPTSPLVPDFQSADIPPMPSDMGSSAPPETPPVILSAPKKKFGGGKIIATILGFLVLVGGIAGGVILTQQQQDIREKAAGSCTCLKPGEVLSGICNKSDGTCSCPSGYFAGSNSCIISKPPPPPPQECITDKDCAAGKVCKNSTCTTPPPQCTTDKDCKSGQVCKNSACVSAPPQCITNRDCQPGQTCSSGACIVSPPPPPPSSAEAPKVGGPPTVSGGGYNHVSGNLCQPAGQQNICSCFNITDNKCLWKKDSSGTCKNNWYTPGTEWFCGSSTTVPGSFTYTCEQGWFTDSSCTVATGTSTAQGGQTCNLNESWCSSAPPPSSPITGRCLNIKAFDTKWNELTNSDLVKLKEGDKVRFTVAGQTSSGTFNKARFKINGTTRPEVTQKRPDTEEFFDEYTIPADINSFTIDAELNHSALGWF